MMRLNAGRAIPVATVLKTPIILCALSLATVCVIVLVCGYFRADFLVDTSRSLLLRLAPQVYSFVHGRPAEVCTSYQEERSRAAAGTTSMREYEQGGRAVLAAPCRGDWIWMPGQMAGHLYTQIARDLPYAWLFVRTQQTEVAIAALLMISALFGAAVLPYVAWRATGSLTGAAVTVLFGALVAYAGPVPGNLGFPPLKLMLAFSGFFGSALLILLQDRPWGRSKTGRFLFEGLLIGLTSLQFLLYLFVAPSAGVMFVFAFPLLAALIAVATANRWALVRSAAVFLVLGALVGDYFAFSSQLLSPISTVNFAAGGSFAPLALVSGFWTERPNSLSIPLGDFGVFLGWAIDPLLSVFRPDFIEYQGYIEYGNALLKAALQSHALEFIEHAGLRLFRKLYFLEYLATYLQPLGAPLYSMLKILLTASLICFLAAMFRRRYLAVVVPVLAIPVFGFYALDFLTHTVHTHTAYFDVGLTQLLILCPLIVALCGSFLMRSWPVTVRLAGTLWPAPGSVDTRLS